MSVKAPVLDAPCGYGRNAIPLAARGCTVVAIDNDRKRLCSLEQVKASYIQENQPSDGTAIGQVLTVCADLSRDSWPIAASSVSAIICIHFSMVGLLPSFISSLKVGGYIYVETFGGQGENYRDLPRAGQLKALLYRHMEFRYYNERKVGPLGYDAVAVTLLARKLSQSRII